MAFLSVLLKPFHSLNSALDAAHLDDDERFFDVVQNRCIHEKQPHSQRAQVHLHPLDLLLFLLTSPKSPNATTQLTFAFTAENIAKDPAATKSFYTWLLPVTLLLFTLKNHSHICSQPHPPYLPNRSLCSPSVCSPVSHLPTYPPSSLQFLFSTPPLDP